MKVSKNKTEYHLTTEEAKRHLNIESENTDYDIILEELISASVEAIEDETGRDYALTDYEITKEYFTGKELTIYIPNFLEITEISYTNADGNAEIIEAKKIHTKSRSFKIELPENIKTDLLTIRFKAGYEAGTLPRFILQAIKIQLTDFFEVERSSYTSNTYTYNKTIQRLLKNEML